VTDRENPPQNGWLLKREPAILSTFSALFMFGLLGGVLRFLFPFQILNLGGSEPLISLGGTFSSLGQIAGLLVLTRIVHSRRNTLLTAGSLLGVFAFIAAITSDSTALAVSRIADGAGSGLFAILVIRVSSDLKSSRGESIGTLLAALFLGSAIGQGLAGATVNAIALITALDQTHTIRVIAAALFLLSLAVLGITGAQSSMSGRDGLVSSRAHGHVHPGLIMHTLSSRPVLILACVYIVYDFSHGIYTPGLSILIENNGVPIDQIAYGYLLGDLVWGATQVYAGRLVDRSGHYGPLFVSLIIKGATVTLYPSASSFIVLTSVLALAGMSEGFIEPSRNEAAIDFTPAVELVHEHQHYYLTRTTGSSFGIARHRHEHTHAAGSDEVVSFLQTLGMAGFAVGSLAGAWLLEQGLTLSTLVFIGGAFLIGAGLLSLGLRRRAIVS
jgi:MFS family permease